MDYEQTYLTYKNLGQGKKFENLPEYSRYKKGTRMERKGNKSQNGRSITKLMS